MCVRGLLGCVCRYADEGKEAKRKTKKATELLETEYDAITKGVEAVPAQATSESESVRIRPR